MRLFSILCKRDRATYLTCLNISNVMTGEITELIASDFVGLHRLSVDSFVKIELPNLELFNLN